MTRPKKRGVISRRRLGWNRPGRGGRTWCKVKMAPTPPNSGLSTRCAPVKYSDSSPPRMIAGLSAATLDASILPADYWDARLTIVCRQQGPVNTTPSQSPSELGGLGAHHAGAACQDDHIVKAGGK